MVESAQFASMDEDRMAGNDCQTCLDPPANGVAMYVEQPGDLLDRVVPVNLGEPIVRSTSHGSSLVG
jgi:hypothetical protein